MPDALWSSRVSGAKSAVQFDRELRAAGTSKTQRAPVLNVRPNLPVNQLSLLV
jgi:hypothetical protein